MEANRFAHEALAPEAATDEPASPCNLHGPSRPDPDLTRDGSAATLTSSELVDGYQPVAADAAGRVIRADGFTPERQRVFLSALAACGVAADACRAAGISRDTAYNLRNRAEGAAFARAWNAALLIARGRVDDELMSRAMHGVVERIYRNGELWGERHRHDNRLAMAVLTRLDKQAAGMGEGAATARAIAQEWDQFLDIVEAGGEGAQAFLMQRSEPKIAEPPAEAGLEPEPGSDAAILGRLGAYRDFGVGLACEVDIGDLEPEEMANWTGEQWARAEQFGLLDMLSRGEWPESVRNLPRYGAEERSLSGGQASTVGRSLGDHAEHGGGDFAAFEPGSDDTNGSCPIRQDVEPAATGLDRVLREFARRFDDEDEPEAGLAPAAAGLDGFDVWEDEDRGCWITNFPPPTGFDGVEYGSWAEYDYCRTLSPEEQAVIDAGVAIVSAEEEASRQAELAAARAARDRAFGFVPASERDDIELAEEADSESRAFHAGEGGNLASWTAADAARADLEQPEDPGRLRVGEGPTEGDADRVPLT